MGWTIIGRSAVGLKHLKEFTKQMHLLCHLVPLPAVFVRPYKLVNPVAS